MKLAKLAELFVHHMICFGRDRICREVLEDGSLTEVKRNSLECFIKALSRNFHQGSYMKLLSSLFHIALLCITSLLSVHEVHAQSTSNEPVGKRSEKNLSRKHSDSAQSAMDISHYLEKTTPAVIAKAKANEAQTLIVLLNVDDIDAEIESRRASNHRGESSSVLDAERGSRIDKIRSLVFPNGKNGTTEVLEVGSPVPMIVVRLLNYDALEQLLRNSRVKRIYENETVRIRSL